MEIIILLLGVSLMVAATFLMAFLWSIKDGQYEDEVSPSVRILYEEQINNKTKDN